MALTASFNPAGSPSGGSDLASEGDESCADAHLEDDGTDAGTGLGTVGDNLPVDRQDAPTSGGHNGDTHLSGANLYTAAKQRLHAVGADVDDASWHQWKEQRLSQLLLIILS